MSPHFSLSKAGRYFGFSCTFNNIFLLCLDTLELFLVGNGSYLTYIPLKKKGIAWWTDKNVKFRNPPGGEIPLEERFKGKILLISL